MKLNSKITGLELLEEPEQQIISLRVSLIEGEESGISEKSVQDIIAAKESTPIQKSAL